MQTKWSGSVVPKYRQVVATILSLRKYYPLTNVLVLARGTTTTSENEGAYHH